MGMFHCHSGPGRWSSKNPVPLAQFILLQGSVKLFGFRQGGKSNDPDKTLLHRLHLNDATVNGYQQNLLGSEWNRCHHQYIPQGYEYRPTYIYIYIIYIYIQYIMANNLMVTTMMNGNLESKVFWSDWNAVCGLFSETARFGSLRNAQVLSCLFRKDSSTIENSEQILTIPTCIIEYQ